MVAEEVYYAVFLIFCLVTGMCIGSFMNVVIYRLPLMLLGTDDERRISLSWPPSHCPACQSKIKWYDNIPLVSWLLLRGKCRHCQTGISALYPLTEAVTGLWFMMVYLFLVSPQPELLTFSWGISLLPPLILFCLLYCITLIDFRHYLIPDSLSLGLLWIGLVFSVADLIPVSPLQSVSGCVLAYLIISGVQKGYALIRKHEGLGGGDAKLFAAASVWLGLNQMPWLILFSAIFGGILYAIHYFYHRKILLRSEQLTALNGGMGIGDTDCDDADTCADKFYIPFGPTIALAALILFLTQR